MENGMDYVNRLVACGFSESSALDICQWYDARSDAAGLEGYVVTIERFWKEEAL